LPTHYGTSLSPNTVTKLTMYSRERGCQDMSMMYLVLDCVQ
jgi:hypothetical protein